MKCRDAEYLLVELADGTIGADDRNIIEMHVASCASCAADLALLSGTFELLRTEIEEAPPAHYFTNLLPKIRRRLETERVPWHIAVPAWLTKVMAPLTVTVMAVIVVGLFRAFEPTEEFVPLKNIVGQVSADELASLVKNETEPYETELAAAGGGSILDILPNANTVADRMKAELLAEELPVQQTDVGIMNDETTLEGLDDEAVSQVLNRMNEGSTL